MSQDTCPDCQGKNLDQVADVSLTDRYLDVQSEPFLAARASVLAAKGDHPGCQGVRPDYQGQLCGRQGDRPRCQGNCPCLQNEHACQQ
eukprot:31089-Chlamydomonas_euryale.AAC.1